MKRTLMIAIGIAAVVCVCVAVFIATFDINTYKSTLSSQLGSLVGGRVEIERLSMAWKGRLILGIAGFKMYTDDNPKSAPVLSFDRAEAGLELMPLLRRQLQLASISADQPHISLVRSKDGAITVSGYQQKAASTAAKAAATPAALGVNISFIRINKGIVRFVDMMGEEPSDITVKSLDADIKNVSLAGPVTFSTKMALASDRQDMAISGTIGGFTTGNISLKDFQLQADLAAFGHGEILKAFPALAKTGFKEGLAGVLNVNIRSLQMAGGKVAELSGRLGISGGRLSLNQVRAPIEDITLDVAIEESTITVKSFAARIVNGILSGSATIENYFTTPKTTLALTAQARGFHEFLATVAAVKQNLDGNARITFNGTMTGSTWPEISNTLSGRGTFALESGIIINANILDQTIGALTVFPNLTNSLQGNVSSPAKQAFSEAYTVLKPLNQPFTIEGGYIMVPDLILQSEFIDMHGDAKMSFAGDISGSAMIRFASSISGAMVMAVPQVKAITDPQGLVTFPINFKGGSGAFKVIPDMKYIGRKIAIDTAGDALSGYLKKAAEIQNDAGAANAASQASEESPSKKAPKLKDFLKAIADEAKKNN
jgi:uncharacterized protein involved in outer membrane biogenesis